MKKPSYKSVKGLADPTDLANHLERLSARVYDRKKRNSKGIKPLVDPKSSRIPGVSNLLKKG